KFKSPPTRMKKCLNSRDSPKPLCQVERSRSSSARRPSVGEVTRQILLEGSPVARLDGLLRSEGLHGFLCELAQPLVVGRIQVEEVRLVGRRHTQREIEERLARGEIRHEPRGRGERHVLDLR